MLRLAWKQLQKKTFSAQNRATTGAPGASSVFVTRGLLRPTPSRPRQQSIGIEHCIHAREAPLTSTHRHVGVAVYIRPSTSWKHAVLQRQCRRVNLRCTAFDPRSRSRHRHAHASQALYTPRELSSRLSLPERALRRYSFCILEKIVKTGRWGHALPYSSAIRSPPK